LSGWNIDGCAAGDAATPSKKLAMIFVVSSLAAEGGRAEGAVTGERPPKRLILSRAS
jgi:hypothetical protein